ncbi:hypothetical protein OS493_035027 [Desmophyllum pertusum]|uniref:Uncharacterized protein n=1 Tax=Desmophyllum pertusum TaxID=174260 RepID=A0A9W9YB21_9CNID|nr:hypothetical protein OS493_035027 [Desmophyllum pertusum]
MIVLLNSPRGPPQLVNRNAIDYFWPISKLYQLAPFIKGEPIRLLNMTIEKQVLCEFQPLDMDGVVTVIYAFFRKAQAAFGDPYFKNPSDEEPFQDIIKYWMRDKVFAEQRLAGVNPMTLMRVTTDRDKVGIKWTELKKTLNQEFDWDNLIINTPNMPKITLEKAIKYRTVFVLRYPLLDYLPAMPDIMESRPGRDMWEPTSPIASLLFIQATGKIWCR